MSEDKMMKLPQNIIIENREKLMISGVKDVKSFDEESVVLDTYLGELVIKGSGLHVSMFDVATGEISVEGCLNALGYKTDMKSGGFFGRLLK